MLRPAQLYFMARSEAFRVVQYSFLIFEPSTRALFTAICFPQSTVTMSVVGVSPSDFGKAIAALIQAVEALKVEDGARSRYQETERNLDSQTRALQAFLALADSPDIDVSTDAAKSAISNVLQETQKRHARTKRKYHSSLGPGAADGKRHGIIPKLKYSFRGEKQEREATLRAVEGFNAAQLESML